jgi:hypothetical protein
MDRYDPRGASAGHKGRRLMVAECYNDWFLMGCYSQKISKYVEVILYGSRVSSSQIVPIKGDI